MAGLGDEVPLEDHQVIDLIVDGIHILRDAHHLVGVPTTGGVKVVPKSCDHLVFTPLTDGLGEVITDGPAERDVAVTGHLHLVVVHAEELEPAKLLRDEDGLGDVKLVNLLLRP